VTAPPEYVGFWARVGAALIDTVMVMVLFAPLAWLFPRHDDFSSIEGMLSLQINYGQELVQYLIVALIVLVFWRSKFAATPGKMIIHAQIVDARTLGRPTLGQLVIRYLGYFVSTFPLCLGLIWVGFDRKKQGWHDKLADTVVIRVRR
jgi:uncharacterized RDD family membrane protein YckC